MSSQDVPNKKPTLQEIIEKIGIGPTQLRFIFTGGGVWFADGAELLLISAVTTAVASEWSLSALERGSMVTIVYIGVLFGNIISGPIADKYGRFHLIQSSYAGIFVFSIISSFMMDFYSLCFWRFFVGFAFGVGQPPWNTLATEITPAKWRVVVNGVSQGLFIVGEIYSCILILLDDPLMLDLQWRRLLQLGAIPSFLFLVAASYFLQQSPFFLAEYGRHDEAREVLEIMQRDNYLEHAFPVDYQHTPQMETEAESTAASPYSQLFRGDLLKTTAIMAYTCFSVNLVYYGTLYAFPQLLPTLGNTGGHATGHAAVQLLVGACWEIPGTALACYIGMFWPRKPVLKYYCIFTFFFVTLFVMGASGGDSLLQMVMWRTGFYGLKCSIQTGWIVAYVYVTEVYPTSVRSTGTAISFAAGRVAAIVSPLMYEKLKESTGSFNMFFYILAASLFINLLIIESLPFETFNESLDQAKIGGYGATEEDVPGPSWSAPETEGCRQRSH